MQQEATLVGGPNAGETVVFRHHYVDMPHHEPVPLRPLSDTDTICAQQWRAHRYELRELTRGVYIGQHESLSGSIDAIVRELLLVYAKHHAPKDRDAESKKFMGGFNTAITLMAALQSSRMNAVNEN